VRGRAVTLAVAAALAAPASAAAHGRTTAVAVDYEAHAAPLTAPLAGAAAVRVYRTDLALRLTALPGHRIAVLGLLGEPFVRLTPNGAYVNEASLTAAGAGLARRSTASREPRWRLYSRTPSVTWHDPRVHRLPPGDDHGRWAIPVLVDGRRSQLEGEIRRVSASPPWPLFAIGAAFLAGTGWIVARRSPGLLRSATTAFGVLAAGATLAIAVSFAAASTAAEDVWMESGTEFALVLLLGFMLFGSGDTRALAGGLLGLLALAVGLTDIPVFLHGIVLSAVPADVIRLFVALAIFAGAAAVVLGLFVFLDVLRALRGARAPAGLDLRSLPPLERDRPRLASG